MASSSNSNSSAMVEGDDVDDDVDAVEVVDVVAVGDAALSLSPQRSNEKHNLLRGWEVMTDAKYSSDTCRKMKTNAESTQLNLSNCSSRDFLVDTETG